MIQELSANTRKTLVSSRCLAMLGNVHSALTEIDRVLASGAEDCSALDQVALLLLKGELLYLECREDESLVVFENAIERKLTALNREHRFVVGENKRNVSIAASRFRNDREAERLHDEQRLTRAKLWDAPAMVHAYESAFEGRHYEALPALWRELVNSYRQGIWSYYRQASKRLTREFVQIGWAYVAEFHAIISQSSDSIDVIANNLIAWRKPELTSALVQRVVHYANLKRHAILACKLFSSLADVIPDSELPTLLKWLLDRATIVPTGISQERLVNAAWETLLALAPRLSPEQATNLVVTATNHESWTKDKADRVRPQLVRAVDECVDALSQEELADLAKQSIHMAAGISEDVNYDKDVLRLFRHISSRSDSTTKELIGGALYNQPPINNLDLIRIAKEFGRGFENKEQVQKMAEDFTKDVRLQVQHLDESKEFVKPAVSLGQITYQSDRKVAVSVYSDMGLRATIAHRDVLSVESIGKLLDAILEMLREPKNTLANKVLMINAIIELADSLTKEMAEQVLLTLQPFAAGDVVGLDVSGAVGDPSHPLNPFKVDLGSAATIQGGALLALSSVEASIPGVYGERLTTLLETAMTSPAPEVRELALTSARRIAEVPDSTIMKLLLATTDIVPDVTEQAFLAVNRHMRDTGEFWNTLAYSMTMAAESQHTDVRRAAAFTIKNLIDKCTLEPVIGQLKSLESLLASDASYLVRREMATDSSPSATG